MTKDKALQILIEELLTINIGDKLVSYYSLEKKYSCSRTVFQKVIIELENQEIVILEKSKAGNIVTNISYNKLLELYFSKLCISCPTVSLQNTQDELTLNILRTFNNLNSTPYFTYSDSTNARITQLENDIVNFAIVTNNYYQKLTNNDFMIIGKFPIKANIYTEFSQLHYNNTIYTLEEQPVLKASDNCNSPTEFNLICKKSIYNLLNNLT